MKITIKRRIVCTAISVVLSASMLCMTTGCGNGKTAADETEASASEVTSSDIATETAPTEAQTEASEPVVASSPVEYYGEMIVKGNEIVGSKTDRYVQVTGMSFFWSNWSQSFYTSGMVEKLVKDYNCEVVRASYGIQDSGIPHDKTDVDRIKTVVEAAIDNGVYVILDWHSHGAHNNPDEAIEFFSMMAEQYGSYDNVIFELYNEPTQVDWETVKEYSELVIPEIRKYSDNLIIVGSPTWSQDVDIASENPVEGENIAYTLHFYAGTHKQGLRDKADRALANGVALFATEWGSVPASGNGAINYDSTAEWVNWMNENHISWCNWAVNDKDESSSIFSADGEYTEAGKLLGDIIAKSNEKSEWKTGKVAQKDTVSFNKDDYKVIEKPREIIVHEIPCIIEAEEYSTMDGVKVETCGEGGQNIGYIETGDSISYLANVSEAGEYTISFRVASQDGGGVITLESDGKEVATVEIPKTGNWQNWETVTVTGSLEAGEQELTIAVPSGGYNINYMEFTAK